ncbi:MAG: AraC family transcriptional regulator [Ferruginibacter sp.]
MKLIKKSPAKSLAPFVKQLWVMDILPADLPYSQLYFPYGSFELIYYVHNPGIMQYIGSAETFSQPSLFYTGQFTKPFFLRFDKPCKCFGISFKPWAGNLLYNIPSKEFTNSMVPVDDLDRDDELSNKLMLLQNNEDIFSLLERYVLKKIVTSNMDEASAAIAQSIINNTSTSDVNEIIAAIGLSRRRIEQRFLASTGLTIGAFNNKIRFQKATFLLQNNFTGESLTQLGYEAGYYDQSHFISEFKKYAAVTPSIFSKQKTELKDFISSLL